MLLLSEADVARALSMRDVIAAVRHGLRAQAEGRVVQPLRSVVRDASGFFGSMPCSIAGVGLGAKMVTFFPDNAARGIHTHHAIVALFDPQTGAPSALLDGRLITEMRTAAVSAVASRALAREGVGVVAILGTGVQARAHVAALREEGLMRELRVWGRSPDKAAALAANATAAGIRATAAATVAAACKGADIICTLTPAQSPILDAADVASGAHVNAVGSSAPHMRELSTLLVASARIFADTIEGALSESGEIVTAIREGALPARPDLTLLCDVVAGKAPGRRGPADITLFKSLGMALEDVACAAAAVRHARERGIGSAVDV